MRNPSPSEHLYIQVDENCALRNTVARAGWRIDSHGRGGFIVAAGSLHTDGVYAVARRLPIAPPPQWMVPHFTPPTLPDPETVVFGDIRPLPDSLRQRYVDKVTSGVATAAPQNAHDTLVRAAYTLGRLVGGGEFSSATTKPTPRCTSPAGIGVSRPTRPTRRSPMA